MNPQKARQILKRLQKHYPNAKIILKYSNDFELLVSVMLSAQAMDIQVNKVTSTLFPKYQKRDEKYSNEYSKFKNSEVNPNEIVEMINFAFCSEKDLENDIKSIGLFKNKSKNVRLCARMLLEKFEGKIPKSISELTTLPGVGRKTANVVLGNAFGIYEGIAVDTHVTRLSQKYGFTKHKNPEKIEKDLMRLFERKDWFKLTYLLIEHGRNIRKTKKDFILGEF